ncbi:MAG: TetR/AcrR family transcriptional regulator [Spirochaetes bacterium]|jgi:AcrR family transcriptional regulator|nr:TetR/AcrR family transcriptional regulator [Spirochaetota bacterium]
MKAELRRQHILDCAKQVFAEKGYYEAYVEDVIKMAHIGKGTIYEYFRNKEDLFLSLLIRSLEEWKMAVNISHEEMKQLNPISYFHHRIQRSLMFLNDDRLLTSIILRTGFGFNPHIQKLIGEFEKNLRKHILHDIRLAKHLGFLREDVDLQLTATILIGGIIMIAYNDILNTSYLSDAQIDVLTDKYINTFIKGLFKLEHIGQYINPE